MVKKDFEQLLDVLQHFELEGGYPIAVNNETAKIVEKYLSSYVTLSKSKWKERPVLLTKKAKGKIPAEIEAAFYKWQYHTFKELFEDMYDKVENFIKEVRQ